MEIRDAISVTTAFHPSDTTLKRHYISLSWNYPRLEEADKKKKKEKRTVYETA